MGGVLSHSCCGGRDDGNVKDLAREKMNEESLGFLKGEGLNDRAVFDKAHGENDIETLVKLLDSTQTFARNDVQIHPWAAPPKSIGSLAAFQLASMASKEAESGDQPYKNKVREFGGIPKLVQFLSSNDDDRKHAAVVALSFLVLENDTNCKAAYDAGALPPLVECMKFPPDGMKGAAADAARNIFVLDMIHKQAFVAAGGVQPLVNLLDLPSGEFDPASLFNQSEAIFHIEDLILDGGQELSQFVKLVKEAGATRRVEALTKLDSATLSDDAKNLLLRLAD
eukprot:Lankesteria_metandrocarpae@DN3062_c0_g1_i1.p2